MADPAPPGTRASIGIAVLLNARSPPVPRPRSEVAMQRLRTAAAASCCFRHPGFRPVDLRPDGVQASGWIYRICMPPAGQHNGTPSSGPTGLMPHAGVIPEEQLASRTVPEPDANGSATFITNSYSKTARRRPGRADILDRERLHRGWAGRTRFSSGPPRGIITTSTSSGTSTFSAGLALCGQRDDLRVFLSRPSRATCSTQICTVSNWSLIGDRFRSPSSWRRRPAPARTVGRGGGPALRPPRTTRRAS
jgi:hypothetical protein